MHLFAIIVAIAFLWTPASAQEAGSPEAMRAANELITIISKQMMNEMSSDMAAQMWPRLEKQLEPRVDKATLNDLRSEFERLLAKYAGEAMKDAPALYARYFNAQELRDMAAFYRTPTGAKTLQLVPKIMAEYTTSSLMPRMQDFQRDIQVSVEYVLRKHGYKK